MKGISSIIATLLMLIVTIGLAALAYGYIMGIWGSRITQTFQVVEVYNDTVTIMNSGSNAITELKGTIYSSPVDAVLQVTPIDSSLVAYWHFDEGAGNVAYDASGNENNGNYYGNNPHTQSNSTVLYLTGGSPINLTHWFYLPDKAILSNVNLIVTYINNTASLSYKTVKVYVNGNYVGSFTDTGETSAKTYTFVNILKTNFTAGVWNSITYEGNVTNITKSELRYQQDIGWVDGKFGKALSFDGSDDYMKQTTMSLYGQKEIMTVGWVYVYSQQQNTAWKKSHMYGKGMPSPIYWFYHSIGSSNTLTVSSFSLVINLYNPTSNSLKSYWYDVPLVDQWVHVAWGLSKITNKTYFYVNGKLVRSDDISNDLASGYITVLDDSSIQGFFVGSNIYGTENLRMMVDETRIYNRALSEEEIKAHASSNVGVAIMPGQTAKVKVLNVPSKGGHTLKLCTPNQCQTIYLTII